jgi:CHAD domain-containing protein
MPDENPILVYWQSELLVFTKNLLSLKEQMNEEAVHDLRVAVKKLRSCFKMYSGLIKKRHKKELPAGIDALFSILGKHRNIEMSKKLLMSLGGKNTALLDPILVYLQLLQDQAGEYSRSCIQKFESKELEEMTTRMETGFEGLSHDEILSKATEIVDSSLKKVEDDLKHFKERSHLVRKQLKDTFYQSKMLHGKGLLTKPQLKTLDTILDHLGNVQDHEVLISNLKTFRKTILTSKMKEYAMIKRIEGRAKKKKDGLLDEACSATEELMGQYKEGNLKHEAPEKEFV